MPNSILSSLLSSASMVVVNDSTGLVAWKNLKVKDVEVVSDAAVTDEPLSTTQYTESSVYSSILTKDLQSVKILNPSRVRITAFSDDISTVESVMNYLLTQDLTITITTKSVIIPTLTLTGVDIEQSPEMLSASKITIELEQAIPPSNGTTFNPKDAANDSTYGVRVQTLPTVSQSASTLYNSVLTKLGGLL